MARSVERVAELRRVGVMFVLACTACTPFNDRSDEVRSHAASHGADAGRSADTDDDAGTAVPRTKSDWHAIGDPCSEDGMRSCAGHASTRPLLCESGSWQPEPECDATERCDTAVGATHGRCLQIAAECTGHEAGVMFCDGDGNRRVCADLVSSEVLACGQGETCVNDGGHPRCACMAGAVAAKGGCEVATSCDQLDCDSNTTCAMHGGKPECTQCPPGFAGSGATGCTPVLQTLGVSAGALAPALTPDRFDYRIDLSLVVSQITLTPDAPGATRVEINGASVPVGTPWTSPALKLGETEVTVVLSSKSGGSATYKIVVARSAKQSAFLKADRPSADDWFGYTTSLSGDTFVVGAMYEDGAGAGVNPAPTQAKVTDSGAAYVFVRDGDHWKQQAYLKAAMPANEECFGAAVAVSGDTLLVGVIGSDPFELTTPPTRSGRVDQFTRHGDTWTQTGSFSAPQGGSAGDLFGAGLELEGDTLVVSTPNEGTPAAKSGAAYVYARSGDSFAYRAMLKPKQPVAGAIFGNAALSGDWMAVGAAYEDTSVERAGAVYMFQRDGDKWVERQRVAAPNPVARGTFGFSLSLLDDVLVVGAPAYDLLVPTTSGSAFVFERSNDTWSLTTTLTANVPKNSDHFGSAVARSATTLAIGASADSSAAPGIDAEASMASAQGSGAVYLYARSGAGWMRSAYIKADPVGADDGFGQSLVFGERSLLVGAFTENSSGMPGNRSLKHSGAVYVFE